MLCDGGGDNDSGGRYQGGSVVVEGAGDAGGNERWVGDFMEDRVHTASESGTGYDAADTVSGDARRAGTDVFFFIY